MPKESTTNYRITLDAIDPNALAFGEGVQVTVAARPFGGGFGAVLVTLEADDRGRLLDYVRGHWGSEAETGLDWNDEIKTVGEDLASRAQAAVDRELAAHYAATPQPCDCWYCVQQRAAEAI